METPKHELNIYTSDGWVVTLVSDVEIDLTGVTLSSIIVQPRKEHFQRTQSEPDVQRTIYQLRVNDEGTVSL